MALMKPRISEEEKQIQLEQAQENELHRLRREYVLLDRDRTRFQEHGAPILAKKAKVMKIFENEHINVLTDLAVASSSTRHKEDCKDMEQINFLLYEYQVYTDNVRAQKIYMRELSEMIKKVKNSILGLKKHFVTDRQLEDRIKAARNTVDALENRLEVQINKFDLVCAKNRLCRELLSHLLSERVTFMSIWGKYLRKLTSGKKIMMDLIEQATIAYDQREELMKKLQVLRQKAHDDLINNVGNMNELVRKQDDLQKMEEFFTIKGQKRMMRDLMEKNRQKREELKKKLQEQLVHYNQMMTDITSFMKESESSKLATKYYNQEERNFMFFKFINDMMGEMEMVNDRLSELHDDIEKQTLLTEDRRFQQVAALNNLEEELNAKMAITKKGEEELKEFDQTFSKIMDGIGQLFRICKCDMDPLLRLLGNNTIITPFNILLYLQVLERTIQRGLITAGLRDKILIEKKKDTPGSRVISTDDKIPSKMYSINEIVPTCPCSLCVEHEVINDIVDRVHSVWSREQARRKIKTLQGAMLHNVSHCYLPRSREMMQKRYM